MRYVLTSCLALALSLTGTAQEQERAKAPPEDQFLLKAASDQLQMISLSNLVESRSDNVQVEAFARKVLADCKAAAGKVGQIVQQRKLGVVTGLEKEEKEQINRLSELKGEAFDRAYLDAVIRIHERCLRMCQSQVKQGGDAPIVAFAKTCVPTIEDHLARARELRKSLDK